MELHAVDRDRHHLRQQRGAELAASRLGETAGRLAPHHRARRASSSSSAGAPSSRPTIAGFVRRYFEIEGLDELRSARGADRPPGTDVAAADVLRRRDSFTDSPTTDEVEAQRRAVPAHRLAHQHLRGGRDYRLTKFTTLSTRYDKTWVEFDRPDVVPDRRLDSRAPQRAHVMRSPSGCRSAASTATAPRRSTSGTRDFDFQDAGGVLRFVLGPHTSGNAAAGFAMLHDRNSTTARSGPVRPPRRRARVRARHDRRRLRAASTCPSFGFGGASNSQELRGYVRDAARTQPALYAGGRRTWRRVDAVRARRARARHALAALDARLFRGAVGCGSKRSTPTRVRTRSSPAAKSIATASACSSSSHNP